MSGYIPDDGPDTGDTRRTFVDRYNAIATCLDEVAFVEGIVDFGAYNGRMARQLCARYGVPGVAVDDYSGLLGDKYVTAINRVVSPRELGKTIREAAGGGATTVLALSVLHHLPEWQKYVGAIERNARYALIETAHPDEVLPEAGAHDQSAAITAWCWKRGKIIHESPGWDQSQMRPTWFMEF